MPSAKMYFRGILNFPKNWILRKNWIFQTKIEFFKQKFQFLKKMIFLGFEFLSVELTNFGSVEIDKSKDVQK